MLVFIYIHPCVQREQVIEEAEEKLSEKNERKKRNEVESSLSWNDEPEKLRLPVTSRFLITRSFIDVIRQIDLSSKFREYLNSVPRRSVIQSGWDSSWKF